MNIYKFNLTGIVAVGKDRVREYCIELVYNGSNKTLIAVYCEETGESACGEYWGRDRKSLLNGIGQIINSFFDREHIILFVNKNGEQIA